MLGVICHHLFPSWRRTLICNLSPLGQQGDPAVSIPSQGEREGDVRGCEMGLKVAQKRGLPEVGTGVDSGEAKKSRVVPPQEASGSDQFSSLEEQGSIPNLSRWRERINIGFCLDELDPKILKRLPPLSAIGGSFCA
ncbi:hypothetical protein Adt_36339 [Abeliophyllum distichum]|uniref:Uncharacterized protein n=1 Tax=Abeliophyllum distichum TaxID=126358 RepID=A0ABD1QHK8_9LAMI